MTEKTFAQEVKDVRLLLGPITQAELARRMGVVVGTVADWEGGRANPQGTARVLLARIRDEHERGTK